jgi:hypothetical protein
MLTMVPANKTYSVRVVSGILKSDVVVNGKKLVRKGLPIHTFQRIGTSTLVAECKGKFVEIDRKQINVCVVTIIKLAPGDAPFQYVVPDAN